MPPKNPKDTGAAAPHPPETLEAALIALADKDARIVQLQSDAAELEQQLLTAKERVSALTEALEAGEAAQARLDVALTAANADLTKAEADLAKAKGAQRAFEVPGTKDITKQAAARAVGIDPAEVLAWRLSDDGRAITVVTVDGSKLDNRA